MKFCILVFVVGVLILSSIGAAPTRADYPVHEVWLGAGGAAAFEKDVFNVPGDLESRPEALFGLGYMLNLDAKRAVGFHIFGTGETTPAVALQTPAGDVVVRFDLNTYHFGARYRHTFTRGAFAPYLYVGAGVASGSIGSGPTGELNYTGFSACVGPGVGVGLGRHFVLAAEGIGAFGFANWEQQPFANSSGKEFNPSLVGALMQLSFVWRRRG